jgi:hypothetical protein
MDTNWFIGLTGSLYTVLLVATLFLLYRTYVCLFTKTPLIGDNLQSRLINLGIASLLFRRFGAYLFIKPFSFLLRCTETVVVDLNALSKNHQVNYGQVALFLNRVLSGVGTTFNGTGLVYDLFLPFVFVVILNMVGKALLINHQCSFFSSPHFKKLISANVRQNITLFILIVASLYFVLCAIIAIPYSGFYHSSPSAKTDSGKFDRKVPEDLSKYKIKDNWVKDSTAIMNLTNDAKIPATLIDKRKAHLQYLLNSGQSYFSIQYGNLYTQLTRVNKLIVNVNEGLKSKISQYNDEIDKNDLPHKLKANYSVEVGKWLSYNIQSKVYNLNTINDAEKNAVDALSLQNTAFRSNVQKLSDRIKNKDTSGMSADTSVLLGQGYLPGAIINTSFDDLLIGLDNITDLPPKPNLGTDWGPLGDATSWLIATQSLDLALIVGMFGFGFLGAAISSFINIRQNLKDNKPIVEDLLVVVIRGFSAAIVIFLATKGGIAVFTDGSANEPNPYVLFFTCLLGAVFSDRIWGWAKTQINSRYQIDATPDGNAPNDAKGEEAKPIEVVSPGNDVANPQLLTSITKLIMNTIHVLGLLENANQATIIITVAGPNHYSFTHSYSGTFDLPLPVESGEYDILVSAFTDGTFTLDIQGTYQSVDPKVPYKFTTNRQAFTLIV